MNDSKNNKEAPLEVEIPEDHRAEEKKLETQERAKIILKKALEKNSNHEKMYSAMAEKAEQEFHWKENRWKVFLFLAVALVGYFLSFAFTDRSLFKDGLKILRAGLEQLFGMAISAVIFYFLFRSLSEKGKEILERIGLVLVFGFVVVFAIFLRGVIGIISQVDSRGGASGTSLFFSGTFLLTLIFQLAIGVFLLQLRNNLLKKIENGEPVILGARSIAYFSEGVQIYVWIGVFLQLVFQIHSLAFYLSVFASFTSGFLFVIPLFGYFMLRRYLLNLN